MCSVLFPLQYTRSAHCYVIVYSITDRRSLDEAQDIYRFCQRVKDEEHIPAVSASPDVMAQLGTH